MANFTSSKMIGSLGAAFTRRSNSIPSYYQATRSQSGSGKGATEAAKQGLDNAMKKGENLKDKAASTIDEVFDKGKESSEGVTERAKKVAQDAWETTKGSAEKAKDSAMAVEVDGPRMESKEAVEMAKRSMNTKKDDNC